MNQQHEAKIKLIQANIPAMFAETINELESKKSALRDLIQNSAGTSDPADRASMFEEQAGLENDIKRISEKLNRYQTAQDAINNDMYGYCASCGDVIAIGRMELEPSTTHCTACKGKNEYRLKTTGYKH